MITDVALRVPVQQLAMLCAGLFCCGFSTLGAEITSVPWSLGVGTGGDGAWNAESAVHSPTRISSSPVLGPAATGAAVLDMTFTEVAYNWCWASVAIGTTDPTGTKSVRVTYMTELPAAFPPLHVMIREQGGESYWMPEGLPLSPGRYRSMTLPLTGFSAPPWSSPGNGVLDAEAIAGVCVGVAAGATGQGRIVIAEIQLLPAGW